jgi:hypothetical protein
MSQRNSGYSRKERDLYETPSWVTEALIPHLRTDLAAIWEPAAASGKMVAVLQRLAKTHASDIEPDGCDFLACHQTPDNCEAIVTNPPYELGTQFCEHALRLMQAARGVVAMLLRVDFDSAKGRANLFRDNPAWAKKLVLTKRIVWFEGGKSPSFNHAWYIWDWRHSGPATIGYADALAAALPETN